MALSLRTKLFAGFGALIGVSVLTGFIIIQKAHVVKERSTFVLEESVPTMLNVSTLRGSIHHALSMHRGYMILGLQELADERLEAWVTINESMNQLKQISSDWPEDQRALVVDLEKVLKDFRVAQDKIAAVSHTPEDKPADKIYFTQAIPKGNEVVGALEKIIVEERGLDASKERKVLVGRVEEAKGHLLKASAAVAAFLVSGADQDEAYLSKCITDCAASVDRLKGDAHLFTPTQKSNFEHYLARRAEFLGLANQAVEIRKGDKWSISQDICLNTVTPLANEADRIAGEIVDRQTESQMAAGADARQQLSSAVALLPKIVVTAGIASALIGVFVAIFLSRNIGKMIREVAARAHAIASRNLRIEPLEVKTKDDLGKLASSVNEMLSSLREIVSEVSASSNEVASASDRILGSSTQVANGMEQQMREVEQISAAVAEMAASVGEVAESSRCASDSASESAKTARAGGEVVGEVVNRMNEIRDAVQASAQSVTELGRQSEQIGEIIEVINDIADQTNLLALNAAIEAARAGEHGRGFAVVADEVRKLAERTQVATEQVSKTISNIQLETTDAVSRMEAGTSMVEQGVSLTQNAGESLGQIVAGAGTVTGQVQSIAAAAEQQAVASEDISRGISEITEFVRSSKGSTDEAANAATELASKASALREIVGRFTL
ncbi:MAG: methyl-accepting chemotaxis protein [Phycisphaerales bacterium]|nr:methyl-accepting chemotaxis protein [Phycisphaerales bacterium]